MGWQWHQLNHMQAICTSLQKITTAAPHQSDFYGPDALPDTQPTASKHWRPSLNKQTQIKTLPCRPVVFEWVEAESVSQLLSGVWTVCRHPHWISVCWPLYNSDILVSVRCWGSIQEITTMDFQRSEHHCLVKPLNSYYTSDCYHSIIFLYFIV